MRSETMKDDPAAMAEAQRAFEEEARGRGLKQNWFAALVVLWIVIWMFVGASGLMPRPLWAVILGLLVISAFAIAIFGPRIGRQKSVD
jgi:fatty acid desaturase